jgi:hypothetical protein
MSKLREGHLEYPFFFYEIFFFEKYIFFKVSLGIKIILLLILIKVLDEISTPSSMQ